MTLFGAHTDAGVAKPVDQDAYCFKEADVNGRRVLMAVVCDGVGGLAKGELASSTVVRRFNDWFDTSLATFLSHNLQQDRMNWGALSNVWETLLQSSNQHLFDHGSKNEKVCGTTFTGMFVYDDRYLIAHVGDCRAYEVTAQEVRQLTHDQTLVAQQVAAGVLTPEEALHHPKRNVIMQSVGTRDGVNPEFIKGAFNATATYVLCCDGFYNHLHDGELLSAFSPETISSEQHLQTVCEELVRADIGRGEKDNITVVAFGAYDGVHECDEAESNDGEEEDEAATTLLGELDDDETPTTVVLGGEAL